MFRRRIIIPVIIILIAAVAVTAFLIQRPRESGIVPTPTSPGEVTPTPTPVTQDKITPTLTPTPQPTANITVTTPTQGETVSRPLRVAGQARTFEQTVNFRLRQADGRILAQEVTTAGAPEIGQFGPYEITINYPIPTQREGILEVFQISPKDGSEIDKVIINVIFANIQ